MADPIGVGRPGANAALIVDEEFRAQIPPLGDEELALLRQSLLRDGCRDPLVIWLGHNIILDGHHRFEICSEYGIPFQTIAYLFESREAAADWIDANQLGRRNLPPDAMSLLRGRRFNRTKQSHGGQVPRKGRAQSEPSPPERTAATLAQQHGVSPATIKRDGVFAKAVQDLKPHVPDIEQRVMAGKVPSREAVVQAAKEPEKAKATFDKSVHASSETSEHYTPAHIVAAVDLCLGGIDLDPCSNSKSDPNVPAANVFTAAENGLTRPWSGTVYMNPPYGSEIKAWIEKLVHEYEDGEVSAAIALVPARPDTGWFLALANYPVCFVSGRLTFIGNDSPAPFPSALVYLGRDPERFHEVFERTGIIRCRWAPGMVLNMMCPHGIDIGDFCAACDTKERARKHLGKARVA
jgi:hypothetical protein